MNKKVLIISPYFPPTNAADMQRVRMSLPYFKDFGWEPEVVTVDERYSDMVKDDLLTQTIPSNIVIHKVKALNKKLTSKLGLGSIALRSIWFYKVKVDRLLSTGKYQLVYFSTTQFPVCVLGARWNKKFGVPYVIDMQDPWHSDHYQTKPKADRPSKYWFSYRLNKFLEPKAMAKVAGIISVSPDYIDQLKQRYDHLKNVPSTTIPFGAFEPDQKIAQKHFEAVELLNDRDHVNLVYVGRGGTDLHLAIEPLFKAMQLMTSGESRKILKIHFIGTSYAPAGTGKMTIKPLAKKHGLEDAVEEFTDRVGYFQALAMLQQADALFIPGSEDAKYSASKIYPYVMTGKPMLTIFNSTGPGYAILQEFGVKYNYSYDDTTDLLEKIADFLKKLTLGKLELPSYRSKALEKYSAKLMTKLQCDLFDLVTKYQP